MRNTTAITRRRRSSETSLSEIEAQFAAIYGVNTDGNTTTDGKTNSVAQIVLQEIQQQVTETITQLEVTPLNSTTRGQGMMIIATPRTDEIYTTYVEKY